MTLDPHKLGDVRSAGVPLEQAAGVVILLHGRGGSAEDILTLADAMMLPHVAYLAPQAAGHSWYPNSFMAPIESNQPWLMSALDKVHAIAQTAESVGIPEHRIAVGGFSQGACLATEFVASHPRKYAALFALTGGLIGPPGVNLSHEGRVDGMPAFFGSSDPDPHVPWQRVQQSAGILEAMGASVTLRRYPGRGHTISGEEIELVRQLLLPAFADKP